MAKVNRQNSLIVILIVVIVVLLAAIIMLWYQPSQDQDSGNRQATVDEKTVDQTAKQPDDSDANYQFTSDNGVVVKLDDISAGQTIASPLEVEGQVPGNWSNEAVFSVKVRDNNGNVLGQGRATLTGDWMTKNYVPFESTVSFSVPSGVTAGQLVLIKANPSGLPENADQVSIPVDF